MEIEGYFRRSCPVCKDSTVSATKSISSKQTAESFPFNELKNLWYGFFKKPIFFTYYRCNQCQVLYCPTYFSHEQLEALYQHMPDNTAGVSQNTLSKTQKGYFKILSDKSPLNGHYLEVGPDIGLFSELCIKNGNFEKFWFFEPNQSVHPALREKLSGKTYSIHTNMFDMNIIPDQSLSVVSMIHVLDHLIDPKSYLNALRRKLKPDCVVLIVTHDESSLLARLTQDRWPAYCLQHPELFRPGSIKTLLNNCGLKTIAISKTYNYFPISFLMKHALWALGFNKVPISGSSGIQLPLKLGNILTLAQPESSGG
jgi:hypothetical protein